MKALTMKARHQQRRRYGSFRLAMVEALLTPRRRRGDASTIYMRGSNKRENFRHDIGAQK